MVVGKKLVLFGLFVGCLFLVLGESFGVGVCNLPTSPNNITYYLSPSYLSNNIVTDNWLIIPPNTTLITNNYNITACKGIKIEKGGSLIQDYVSSNNQPLPSKYKIPSAITTNVLVNDGTFDIYGKLNPGILFFNNGSVFIAAQNFINFSDFINYKDGIVTHENYLYNGGGLDAPGGSVPGSLAGSGGGGAAALGYLSSGYAGGSTYAAGGQGGSGENQSNISAMMGKPGSSVSGSLENYTFNLNELSSAGGGDAAGCFQNPCVAGGSGVYPLFIISNVFVNNGSIRNQGGAVSFQYGDANSLGGSGGGGIIMILYAESYKNNGNFNISGGPEQTMGDKYVIPGGVGGPGKVFSFKIGANQLSNAGLLPNFSLNLSAFYDIGECRGVLHPVFWEEQTLDGFTIYNSTVTSSGNSTALSFYYYPSSLVSYKATNTNRSFLFGNGSSAVNQTLGYLLNTSDNRSLLIDTTPTGYALSHNSANLSFSNGGFFGAFNVSVINSTGGLLGSYSYKNDTYDTIGTLPTGVYTIELSNGKTYPIEYQITNTFNCFSANQFKLYPMADLYEENGLNITDYPSYIKPIQQNLSYINGSLSAILSQMSRYHNQTDSIISEASGQIIKNLSSIGAAGQSYSNYISAITEAYYSLSQEISSIDSFLNSSLTGQDNLSMNLLNKTSAFGTIIEKLYQSKGVSAFSSPAALDFQMSNASDYTLSKITYVNGTEIYYLTGQPGVLSFYLDGKSANFGFHIDTVQARQNPFSISAILSYAALPEIISVPDILAGFLEKEI